MMANTNNAQEQIVVGTRSLYGVSIDDSKIAATVEQRQSSQHHGSTVLGASLNLCNSIVGAGCIGFGGAIAESGGIISIAMMIFFAYLTKVSFDLLIDISLVQEESSISSPSLHPAENASYEALGSRAFGKGGKMAVLVCKGGYTFLCLVAYMIIIRDNFASAVRHLLVQEEESSVAAMGDQESAPWNIFLDDKWSTLLLSTAIMLPLCLVRDLKLLVCASTVKIVTFFFIIFIVVYLFWTTRAGEMTATGVDSTPYVDHWFQVRPGSIRNMGTFVFTFMAQNTVHVVFQSLRRDLQNSTEWEKVSTFSVLLSLIMCLPIGLFVYMTFWENTTSNLFELYPPSKTVDMIRILLTLVMLLTYPPNFFSLREQFLDMRWIPTTQTIELPSNPTEKQTLLPKHAIEKQSLLPRNATEKQSLLPRNAISSSGGSHRRVSLRHHVLVTILLWAITLVVSLSAPSLGDILNLCGCAFGTAIAFIIPAIFSYRLRGFTLTGAVLFVVGGAVGSIGTYQSLVQIFRDVDKLPRRHL